MDAIASVSSHNILPENMYLFIAVHNVCTQLSAAIEMEALINCTLYYI